MGGGGGAADVAAGGVDGGGGEVVRGVLGMANVARGGIGESRGGGV